jgi:hypothetical protein
LAEKNIALHACEKEGYLGKAFPHAFLLYGEFLLLNHKAYLRYRGQTAAQKEYGLETHHLF